MEFKGNDDKNEEEIGEIRSKRHKLEDFIPIYIPTVETRRRRRFLDFLKAHPSTDWLRVAFVRKMNWPSVIRYCKNWIKHPMNMALLVWLFFVAAGLVVLFLLMTGILNTAIPKSSERSKWTEITNQILNALFTIMCLYQYPRLVYHLVILCRWGPRDAVELRQAYCKSTVPKANERMHMAIVLLLLHITCWSQFVLCGLYWGWSSKGRPGWAANVCIALGTGAPVIAGIYTVYSPLGKKNNNGNESEADTVEVVQKQFVVTDPQWVGGLFDCHDNDTVACLSFFCMCCAFGWNMERVGFGNMYVHIVTFILLCVGPLLVFNITALNITDDTLRITARVTGIVLCFFGLFYGGFWRTQMRKKFKLPGSPFCCGYPSVTDWMQWLFCGPCSLSQEVRTRNFYEIEDGSFYRREFTGVLEPQPGDGPMTLSSSDSRNRDSSLEYMPPMLFNEETPPNERDQKISPPLEQIVQTDDKGITEELKQIQELNIA